MPHCIIYARKSTESEDRQALSIASQISELRLLALRHQLAVDRVLQESHSAKAPGRPVFSSLMHDVEAGRVTTILCWKLDRLSRNHADSGRLLQALADQLIQSIITPEKTYTGDGNDRFMGGFELGASTKYIDDLRTNIRRGQRFRRQRGWPNYRPPIGYLEDHATKTVIKDPVRFALVRQLWDLLLSGAMRPSQLVTYANEVLGLRTHKSSHPEGNPIRLNHLYAVFHNPFYLGVIKLRSGETVKGSFPAMVSPEEFQRVQEILGWKSRPRPSKHEFAYAGMLRCAKCGGLLTGEIHRRPGRTYLYYRCRGRSNEVDPCPSRALTEERFEQQITSDLRRLAIAPEAGRWLIENLRTRLGDDAAKSTATRVSLQQALTAAENEWYELVTMKRRQQIDEETFERHRVEVSQRKTHLQLKLAEPAQTPEQLVGRAEEVLNFAATSLAAFQRSMDDPIGRREIVQAISSNWTVENGKCVYLAKAPFSFLSSRPSFPVCMSLVKKLRTWLHQNPDVHLPSLPRSDKHRRTRHTSRVADARKRRAVGTTARQTMAEAR